MIKNYIRPLLGLALVSISGTTATAQQKATEPATVTGDKAAVYEVASIKPVKFGPGVISIDFLPEGFRARNTTLQILIQFAYSVEENQISGGPSWLDRESYDVEAKVDSPLRDKLLKLTEDQRQVEQQPMLQALLAERFKLELHRETKELPVYNLVIAKNGPKLSEAKPGDTYPGGLTGLDGRGAPHLVQVRRGRGIIGQAVPIGLLVHSLTEELGRPVLDKTGLKGSYDFKLEYAPESQGTNFSEPGTGGTVPRESSGPSIFTAIQEQLGLKLESTKGPVEILVIDHVEKPSEN